MHLLTLSLLVVTVFVVADPIRKNPFRTYTARVSYLDENYRVIGNGTFYADKKKNLLRIDLDLPIFSLWSIADFNTKQGHLFSLRGSGKLNCTLLFISRNPFEEDPFGEMKYEGIQAVLGHIVNRWTKDDKLKFMQDAFTMLPVQVEASLGNVSVSLRYDYIDTRPPESSYFTISRELKNICNGTTMNINL